MLKVSFLLDQDLHLSIEETTNILRNVASERTAFGYYSSFKPETFKVEEVVEEDWRKQQVEQQLQKTGNSINKTFDNLYREVKDAVAGTGIGPDGAVYNPTYNIERILQKYA